MTDFYRDPEAVESEATDEAKVPGADEVGAAAIDQGFNAGGDWEVANPSSSSFAAAPAAANASWEASGDGAGDWNDAAAGTTAEWGASEAAGTTTKW